LAIRDPGIADDDVGAYCGVLRWLSSHGRNENMANDHAIESIPLRREPVDVGVLLELTTEVMQRQAQALGVTLAIHIDENVPDTVRVDRDKVAWAITSLVGSALRHVRTPDGSIDVHVGTIRPHRICPSASMTTARAFRPTG
jgi:signal transduction histidine kinase